MSYKVKKAIEAINSNAKFRIVDDSVDHIEWLEGTTPIAKSDIEAKMTALDTSNKMEALRIDRNILLAACDWTQVGDSPLTSTKKTEWATYRQQLRDLPTSANPTIDDNGRLNQSSVTWPTKPS